MPQPWRVALLCAFLAACGGESPRGSTPAPEVDSLSFETAEQIQMEIEILDNEIADLRTVLAQDAPAARVAAAIDPALLLEQAAIARRAAEAAMLGGDLSTASDSLVAASRHVEEVKRSLGLAEEWGF